MNHLHWALVYLGRGLSTIPIKAGEKFPLITNWEDKKVSEDDVRKWWGEWPTADLGFVTGPETNLLVLDVDQGGSTALINKPLPLTWIVKTKRGFHYYFKFPKELSEVATTRRGIYPGVDVRGRGGQVLAPPSKLGSSTPSYVWVRDFSSGPLAGAPEWLIKLLLAERFDTDNLGDLHAGAIQGTRHDTLVRLVSGWFNQGFTEPQIIPMVEEWNTKNNPPLAAKRLADDLNGILHYFRTGTYLTRKQRDYKTMSASEDTSHVESPAVAVDDYFKHLDEVAKLTEPEMKFGWKKLDEPTWGLERKEIIVIGAGPGVGKTNLLMNVAVNLGVQGKRVLYFSTEMDRNKIYHRYFALATGVPHRAIKTGQITGEQKQRLLAYKETFRTIGFHISKAHAPDVHTIRSAAEKYEPDVLILDYLQHTKMGDVNNRRLEIAELMMGLKELGKDLNMAVICASQFNRPSKDLKSGKIRPFTIYDFAESSNIEKEATIALILQKPEETADVMIPVQLDVVKNRDDSMPSFQLMFDKRTAKFYEEILDEF